MSEKNAGAQLIKLYIVHLNAKDSGGFGSLYLWKILELDDCLSWAVHIYVFQAIAALLWTLSLGKLSKRPAIKSVYLSFLF